MEDSSGESSPKRLRIVDYSDDSNSNSSEDAPLDLSTRAPTRQLERCEPILEALSQAEATEPVSGVEQEAVPSAHAPSQSAERSLESQSDVNIGASSSSQSSSINNLPIPIAVNASGQIIAGNFIPENTTVIYMGAKFDKDRFAKWSLEKLPNSSKRHYYNDILSGAKAPRGSKDSAFSGYFVALPNDPRQIYVTVWPCYCRTSENPNGCNYSEDQVKSVNETLAPQIGRADFVELYKNATIYNKFTSQPRYELMLHFIPKIKEVIAMAKGIPASNDLCETIYKSRLSAPKLTAKIGCHLIPSFLEATLPLCTKEVIRDVYLAARNDPRITRGEELELITAKMFEELRCQKDTQIYAVTTDYIFGQKSKYFAVFVAKNFNVPNCSEIVQYISVGLPSFMSRSSEPAMHAAKDILKILCEDPIVKSIKKDPFQIHVYQSDMVNNVPHYKIVDNFKISEFIKMRVRERHSGNYFYPNYLFRFIFISPASKMNEVLPWEGLKEIASLRLDLVLQSTLIWQFMVPIIEETKSLLAAGLSKKETYVFDTKNIVALVVRTILVFDANKELWDSDLREDLFLTEMKNIEAPIAEDNESGSKPTPVSSMYWEFRQKIKTGTGGANTWRSNVHKSVKLDEKYAREDNLGQE